jgi:hypothetical protein
MYLNEWYLKGRAVFFCAGSTEKDFAGQAQIVFPVSTTISIAAGFSILPFL